MKKIFFVFTFLTLFLSSSYSQELGVRFGDALGNESAVAIDAMLRSNKWSRLHLDVSFGGGVGAEILWDFLHSNLGASNIKIYSGFGPSFYFGDPFLLGISFELGAEYYFANAPFVIGADWRPTFRIVEDTGFEAGGFGLNVRFIFGQKDASSNQ